MSKNNEGNRYEAFETDEQTLDFVQNQIFLRCKYNFMALFKHM